MVHMSPEETGIMGNVIFTSHQLTRHVKSSCSVAESMEKNSVSYHIIGYSRLAVIVLRKPFKSRENSFSEGHQQQSNSVLQPNHMMLLM